jgi:hypothetical protein
LTPVEGEAYTTCKLQGIPKTKILAGARKQKQKTFSQVKIPVEILLYPREK